MLRKMNAWIWYLMNCIGHTALWLRVSSLPSHKNPTKEPKGKK